MTEKSTNPWIVLVVLVTGFFMIMLDTTIVNVAIPAMSAGLNTTLDQILWVLNAYILVYAVLLITAGRLGDLYGQRNLFAIGLAIFTVASALCGFAQNANELIAARVLQGVGGALLTPQTLAILTTLFPPDRRGAAFGIWAGSGWPRHPRGADRRRRHRHLHRLALDLLCQRSDRDRRAGGDLRDHPRPAARPPPRMGRRRHLPRDRRPVRGGLRPHRGRALQLG